MKLKLAPFRGKTKVRFYSNSYGVVQSGPSKLRLASSFMSVLLVLGGTGYGSLQLVDKWQASRQTENTSYQRQSANIEVDKKAGESDSKLKNASTQAKEDPELAKSIKDKLKNVPGGQKWSIYVRDIKTERMAGVDADEKLESSLANLFLLPPLESKQPAANWNYRGGKLSLNKCVEEMIKSNDQDCKKSIAKYIDYKSANATNNSFGFKKTDLNDKKQVTTLREVGDMLFRLQNGQVLSDKARRIVFDGLYVHSQQEGIPAGCADSQCIVAQTSFQSGAAKQNAGIVTAGSSQYVVVISAPEDANASWSQIADVAKTIQALMQP